MSACSPTSARSAPARRDLLELRERVAAVADHAIAALDQILRDRMPILPTPTKPMVSMNVPSWFF